MASILADHPDVAIAGFDYEHHTKVRLRDAIGSWRMRGVAGMAFVVRPNLVADLDLDLIWWYGDCALIRRTLQNGHRVVVVEGIDVACPEWEMTMRHYPELEEAKERDRHLWYERYGDDYP